MSTRCTSVSTTEGPVKNTDMQFFPCQNLFNVKESIVKSLAPTIDQDILVTTPSCLLKTKDSCGLWKSVMKAFPTDDRATTLQDLDLSHDVLPTQRSLGVSWNLKDDTFIFNVKLTEKPFTRRGVLSIINSIYDPIGLAVPGKLLLQ